MMTNFNSPIHPTTTEVLPWYNRISWASIFAGLVIALALQILLSLLGIGVGLSTVDPVNEAHAASGLGTGAAIWFAISAIVSMFVGGLVGARSSNSLPNDGILHGLLVWALTTLMMFYLVTTAVGRVVSGVGSIVGAGLSATGTAVAAVAPDLKDSATDLLKEKGFDLDNIRKDAETILRQTGKTELQPEVIAAQVDDAKSEAASTAQANANVTATQQNANLDELLTKLFSNSQATINAVDREAVVNVLVARGQTQAQAEQTVDGWIGSYQTAQQKLKEAEVKAREVADQVASTSSKASLLAFFVLLLGAVAASAGGFLAGRQLQKNRLENRIG